MTLRLLPLALLAAAVSPASAFARTLHVAPQVLAGVPADSQTRTISEAARLVEPGDEVILHAGTYREAVVIDRSGTAQKPITFRAARGAQVIVTGADRIEKWDKLPSANGENQFVADWPYRFITWSKTGTQPGDDEHKMIGRAEQVFINGYPLLQVLERSQLARNTFYADLDAKKLYVQASNNASDLGEPGSAPRVEGAVRGTVWESKGDYIHLRGVRFRYASNQAQQGMGRFTGRFNSIEDCVFEYSNGVGASLGGPDLTVRRCTFADNGQMGWGAGSAHRMHMVDCLTTRNNLKNFERGWEAGGDKTVLSRDVLIEHSRFVANRGVGIWFDIGNENPTIANCLIADNEDAGIFYEISYGLHAHDNVITGNGFAGNSGAWGANGGLALSSSPNCVIERNLFVGNKEGFQFREQGRTTPRIDAPQNTPEVPVWNHDQLIRNNVLAYNRDAQVWGWFDVLDQRLWPTRLQEAPKAAPKASSTQAQPDIAAAYLAKSKAEQEAMFNALSLEKLGIRFENNFYARDEGSGLFNWGAAWRRNRKYIALAALRSELGFEKSGTEGDFAMRDYLTRDFRLPANSPVWKMKAYPVGDVPGVLLGMASGNG